MTIQFVLPLITEDPRERFVVEISREGEMSFPGYEERLEYDTAFRAMGGDPSRPLVLMERWEISAGRSHVIAHNLGLGRKVVRRIAADCVAHITPCYEAGMPGDGRFREALSRLYRSIEHDITPYDRDTSLYKAQKLIGKMEVAVEKINDKAASMAQNALSHAAKHGINLPNLTVVRTSCAMAGAFYVVHDEYDGSWNEAVSDEEAWQIRRFHDVIAAMQHGEEWPPLEATT